MLTQPMAGMITHPRSPKPLSEALFSFASDGTDGISVPQDYYQQTAFAKRQRDPKYLCNITSYHANGIYNQRPL